MIAYFNNYGKLKNKYLLFIYLFIFVLIYVDLTLYSYKFRSLINLKAHMKLKKHHH